MAKFSTDYYVDYDNVEGKNIDTEFNSLRIQLQTINALDLYYQYEENMYSAFLIKGPEFKTKGIVNSHDKDAILVTLGATYNDFIHHFNNLHNTLKLIVNNNKKD